MDGTNYDDKLMSDLKLEDGAGFQNFTRMSPSDFEALLVMVGGKISRKNTKCRRSIPLSIRLVITLRFLASGDSYISLMYTFKISKQSITAIVPKVCEAIITSLKEYNKVSKNKQF